MSIISVKDMCLWYGDHQALKDVSIEIPEKSITAFIGPSGCGKSTFLKTLNRMNDLIPGVKITGDIRYEGTDIFAKCFCTIVAAKLIRTVKTINIAAMAKATPNSPCSFA